MRPALRPPASPHASHRSGCHRGSGAGDVRMISTSEFRDCLDKMGWSQRQLAQHLQVPRSTTQRWATGDLAIPENVSDWLVVRAAHDAAHPMPDGWRSYEQKASRLDQDAPMRVCGSEGNV